MDLFPIHHKSGLTVRLGRLPLVKYFVFDQTVNDLYTLYNLAGNLNILLKRKEVRKTIEWCLEQFPVMGYNPEPNWEWVSKSSRATYTLFFKEVSKGVYGTLYAWATEPPVLPEPSEEEQKLAQPEVPSSGDTFIDLVSGLVYQGQFQDAIALTERYSLQDITRLNWRISELLKPPLNQQLAGIANAKKDGSYDEIQKRMQDKAQELLQANAKRLGLV